MEKRGTRFTVFLLVRNGKFFFLPNPLALPTTAFSNLSETDARAAADALGSLRRRD